MEILDINVERLFKIWKDLERNGREAVEKEIRELTRISTDCLSMLSSNAKDYRCCYEIYRTSHMPQIPILQDFFEKLKYASQEDYEFFAEGHDLVNLGSYLAFDGKGSFEIVTSLCEFKNYVQYLSHCFRKMLNQTDEKKKRVIFRGLIGL